MKGEAGEDSCELTSEELLSAHPTHIGHHFSCTQRVEVNQGPVAGQKAPSFCFHSGTSSLLCSALEWGKCMALLFVPGSALQTYPHLHVNI